MLAVCVVHYDRPVSHSVEGRRLFVAIMFSVLAVPAGAQDRTIELAGRSTAVWEPTAVAGQRGPAPVLIFSHGFGGCATGVSYLMKALAKHGYWVFAPQQTQFNLLRVNVFKVLSRLFSADFWFDGSLALLKLVLSAVTVFWVLASGEGVQGLVGLPQNVALGHTAAWLERSLLALATALALVAALDVGWRWWRYLRRHAMSWRDVLAESREAEVSPEIRAQLRDRQQQAGQVAHAEGAATLRSGLQSIDEVIG